MRAKSGIHMTKRTHKNFKVYNGMPCASFFPNIEDETRCHRFMKRQTFHYLKCEGNRKGWAFFTALRITMVLVNKKRYITETISWVVRNKHSKYVKKRRFSKDCFKYSLFLLAVREWNKLPQSRLTRLIASSFRPTFNNPLLSGAWYQFCYLIVLY